MSDDWAIVSASSAIIVHCPDSIFPKTLKRLAADGSVIYIQYSISTTSKASPTVLFPLPLSPVTQR
jgi:hypothetical protein